MSDGVLIGSYFSRVVLLKLHWLINGKSSSDEKTTQKSEMTSDHSIGFLSLANQFFHWSLQHPSGGLLNVFFAPKGEGTFQINTKKERQASVSKLLRSVVLGVAVDQPISEAMPKVDLGLRTTPVNSNREGVIIWPPFITLIFILALLLMLGWRFTCSKAQSPRKVITPGSGKWRSLSHVETVLLISCIILELIAVTFLGFFFKESNEITKIFESGGENNSSLVKSVEATSIGLQTFLSSGILSGQRTVSEAFKELEGNLTMHLQNRSDVAIDVMYRHLQVKETLATQSEMVRLMDVHVAAMESGHTDLLTIMEIALHFLIDLTNAERNLTRVLRSECDHTEQCKEMIIALNASTRYLTQLPFRTDSLQEPITALLNFKAKLDPWFLLVHHLDQSLTQARTRLSNHSSLSTINLSPTVEAVWSQVEMQVNSLNKCIQSLEQEVVSSLNKTTRTSVTAAISSVGGVFICLLLLLGVFTGGFLQITVKERYLQTPRKFRKDTSACRLSVINLCAFLVISAAILTALVICTTFGSSLLYTEGCVYLEEDKYLSKFDAVLSGYMQGIWAQIGGETVFGLPPPKNLLSAAVRDCGRSGVGLFALIGWNSFPDLPTLLHSENVQRVIQEGRGDLMESLQRVQNELAGKDTLSQLNDGLSRLILAHNEAQRVMKEFASQGLDLTGIEEISQNLATLQSAVPAIAAAGESFINICRRAPEMQAAMRRAASEANAFRGLNNVEVMAKRFLLQITNLAVVLRNSSELDSLLWDVYTDTTWHLNRLCEPLMRPYVERLFPCQELPIHFSNLINTVCGGEGLLARIYVWGVVVWIEMILLFLFCLPLIFGVAVVKVVLAETGD
ncbi:hypothetical protein TcWFU_002486 [Taenia crassiceps]|uniref:Uncharacterized protein n=1 Tax=Taenia crassiceps TaxID=6207 RepID=A0ABR4Q3H7_9CEST